MLRIMPLLRMRLPTKSVNNVTKCSFQISQIRWCSQSGSKEETWISTLDESKQKRIRFVQTELTLHRVEDKHVPEIKNLTIQDYEHILTLSQTQRHKYYVYLYKVHNSEGAMNKKGAIRRLIQKEKHDLGIDRPPNDETGHIEYGLGKGALIPKIYHKTIDKWKNTGTLWRVAVGAPNLIFDCGYSQEMTIRENGEAAKQLALCFGINRSHGEPFALHFCGLDRTNLLWTMIQKRIPTLGYKALPLFLHDQPVHEAFPKEKLVLLTPDSPNTLREYNPDDNYVISGIVDRGDKVPLTLAKAKKLDIRTARLPLEAYRNCRINKAITLDQMLCVMLEIKRSGDWDKAFRYIAARKFF